MGEMDETIGAVTTRNRCSFRMKYIMHVVYRVEHEKYGNGPFRSDYLELDEDEERKITCLYSEFEKELKYDDWYGHRHNLMSPPGNDPKLCNVFHPDHHCGYKSFEDLDYFMGSSIKAIMSKGYRAYKMEVKHIHVGEKQVLFWKKDVVSKEDISDSLSGVEYDANDLKFNREAFLNSL